MGNPPDQQSFMDGIERMVRNTMTGVFAEQKEIERAKDFATTTAPVSGLPAIVGTDPSSLPILPPIVAPLHILSRWSWVSQDTIDSIGNGTFDIDSLPKLHRTDELGNTYLKRSKQRFYHPLDGGPAEVVVGTTKLQSSFKDPTTFFLAWNIYISIRTTAEPARAPGLANWTERVFYFVHLNYPWASILEYIIAFYGLNQTAPAESWFEPNPTLMAYHLTLVQQRSHGPAPAPTTRTGSRNNSGGGSKSRLNNQNSDTIADEICQTYNRPKGCTWKEHNSGNCPRRHVCGGCTSPQHTILACPQKSAK
jgi:hypothetical protein